MTTTLAVLTVLGIFVGIPALVGLAIAAAYIKADGKAHQAQATEAKEYAEVA